MILASLPHKFSSFHMRKGKREKLQTKAITEVNSLLTNKYFIFTKYVLLTGWMTYQEWMRILSTYKDSLPRHYWVTYHVHMSRTGDDITGIIPVSYTHLDVYKRQHISSP